MSSIFFAFLAIATIWWLWRDSLAARELAVGVCRRSCQSEGLQFLDDTVALASIQPVFPRGRPALRRAYQFDFSRNGDDRESGTITLTGTRLETLYIPNQLIEGDVSDSQRGVVIDLEDATDKH